MIEITKVNLKNLSKKELTEFMLSLGEPKFRAEQIYKGIYKNRFESISQFTDLSKSLRETLELKSEIPTLKISKHLISIDGTHKMTFEIDTGKEIEAVWIPSEEGRKTICISSQVGCTLSCAFCATGTMDFQGNLKTWQIIDQILLVEKIVGDKCTNVVFMGMGEPMHNYANVISAAHILHDPDTFNLGGKRITISTAGVIPGIERFIDENQPFNFAISLNHPDSTLRKNIMEIDTKFPLNDLLKTARRFTKTLGRKITFEYIMIPGVNMGKDNASKLVKIARSVNCKINLIPLNTDYNSWKKPTEEEMKEFRELIHPANVPIMNRRSPGKDIHGACGMLALKG